MITQKPVDPVSSIEKYLVWGLFFCFLLIIVLSLVPDSLFDWMQSLGQSTNSVFQQ